MAESKSKKSADKFFDVAKPGKTAPSSTSRPVIITNRPVLKDPMVIRVDTGDDDTVKDANAAPDASTEMKHKVDIKPLHIDLESVLAPSAPEVKKSAKKATVPKDKDEKPADESSPEAPKKAIAIQDESNEPAEQPESEAHTEASAESMPEAEPVKPEELAAPEPVQEQVKDEKPADEPAKDEKPAERLPTREKVIAPPAESTSPESEEKPTEPDAPAEDAPAEFGTDENEPSLDNSDKPVLSEKEAKAAEAAKQKAAEQEKIIASGEFYLPINAVEKRRMKRNILIGIVLLVILLVATALAAWDAGMFSIPGYQPPTNFL